MQREEVITVLTIKNQTDNTAELYISGTIVDDEEGGWVSYWRDGNTDGYQFPQDLKRQLDGLKGKDLTIYINSYGGEVTAGLAMAHMIERHDGKTTAIVDGIAASIATQIFFSADVCKCPSNAYLMIHKPWSLSVGDANEMRKVADILDTLQTGLEIVYNKKALDAVTPEDIHSMVEDETWLTGKEAAEKFNIELLDALPIVNCAGSLDKLKAIGAKKIPQSLNFSTDKKQLPDWADVEITLARAKGVI